MGGIVCPNCGTQNPAHSIDCESCGGQLHSTVSDSQLETATIPDSQAGEVATPGHVISHYRILARIGGGGMGVVYRAEDTRLKRPVALKFLPWEWSDDPKAKHRFIHEARAASALDHSNICTVYDIDETPQGRLFMVMAFCQGATLKQKIRPDGLPLDEALEYAAQIASGLDAAHKKGIVHRDLKPANVFITDDDSAKILDFGLAIAAGQTRLTRPGSAVGTPAYMSPEQARGGGVDPRSDLWSLGVILYQMLTGRLPFESDYAAAMINSILRDDPDPPSRHRPDLPAEVEHLVLRLLEKDAAGRPASAEDVAEQIAGLRTGTVSVTQSTGWHLRVQRLATRFFGARLTRAFSVRRVRVGALVALALAAVIAVGTWWPEAPPREQPETPAAKHRIGILAPRVPVGQAHLADWPDLVQMLYASELAGVSQLAIVDPMSLNGLIEGSQEGGRTSRSPELLEILQPARLSYLIDGTVLETEEGHHLSTILLDAESGEVLYSSTALVEAEELLAPAIRDAAGEILDFLQLRIEGLVESDDFQPWISLRDRKLEAVKAFLHANRHIYRLQPGGDEFLRRAIEIDPEFIAPRLWLISGLVQDGEMEEAMEHLRFLQTLESKASPFEHAMIGWAGAYIEGDLAREARQLEIALEYSPGNNILLQNLAIVRYELGDLRGAAAAIGPAVEMGWSYPAAYVMLARCHLLLGQFPEARSVLESALEQPAPAPEIYAWLEGFALLDEDREAAHRYRGQFDERLVIVEPDRQRLDLASGYRAMAERALELDRPEAAEELLSRAERAATAAQAGPEEVDGAI